MKIIQEAVAGTLESSDLLVKVAPGQPGRLDIHIRSEVMRQFGDRIREVVVETLARLGVTSGDVSVDDKGALDCAVRARVQAAVLRAAGGAKPDWEALQ
jgi:citrate lyase subunit gamma (acyl carrier protein)